MVPLLARASPLSERLNQETDILPKTDIEPEKLWLGEPFLLGRSILRGYVSFREGIQISSLDQLAKTWSIFGYFSLERRGSFQLEWH